MDIQAIIKDIQVVIKGTFQAAITKDKATTKDVAIITVIRDKATIK